MNKLGLWEGITKHGIVSSVVVVSEATKAKEQEEKQWCELEASEQEGVCDQFAKTWQTDRKPSFFIQGILLY
ncbi:MAG: hypothetical protein WC242_00465 [Candidatus Paceibacterota bacterium]